MSVDVVQKVKDDLVTSGVDLSGPCGAFKITEEVARRLPAKVIKKSGGVNCGERSIDGIISGSKFVDILINAGGEEASDGSGPIPGTGNIPAWQERDATPDELSRAVDPTPPPLGVPSDPTNPHVDPPPPSPDLSTIEKALQGIEGALHTVASQLARISDRVDTIDLKIDALSLLISTKKAPDYQGSGSVGPFNVKVNLTPKV